MVFHTILVTQNDVCVLTTAVMMKRRVAYAGHAHAIRKQATYHNRYRYRTVPFHHPRRSPRNVAHANPARMVAEKTMAKGWRI
jgi:hypothetical protein